MTTTDSPVWMTSTDLHQANRFAKIICAMCDYTTAEGFPQLDAATAELDDLIVRRIRFSPD